MYVQFIIESFANKMDLNVQIWFAMQPETNDVLVNVL